LPDATADLIQMPERNGTGMMYAGRLKTTVNRFLAPRSPAGSDNISILGSLTQTAAPHGARPLEMFRTPFKTAAATRDLIFTRTTEASLSRVTVTQGLPDHPVFLTIL
jgi:hypothetical protein